MELGHSRYGLFYFPLIPIPTILHEHIHNQGKICVFFTYRHALTRFSASVHLIHGYPRPTPSENSKIWFRQLFYRRWFTSSMYWIYFACKFLFHILVRVLCYGRSASLTSCIAFNLFSSYYSHSTLFFKKYYCLCSRT